MDHVGPTSDLLNDQGFFSRSTLAGERRSRGRQAAGSGLTAGLHDRAVSTVQAPRIPRLLQLHSPTRNSSGVRVRFCRKVVRCGASSPAKGAASSGRAVTRCKDRGVGVARSEDFVDLRSDRWSSFKGGGTWKHLSAMPAN